jgi:hypothetical protein
LIRRSKGPEAPFFKPARPKETQIGSLKPMVPDQCKNHARILKVEVAFKVPSIFLLSSDELQARDAQLSFGEALERLAGALLTVKRLRRACSIHGISV